MIEEPKKVKSAYGKKGCVILTFICVIIKFYRRNKCVILDSEADIFDGSEPLINFTDTVSLAYQGFLINDTRFDGNYYGTFDKEVNDNYTKFDVSDNGYIVGWTTAMIHMKPDMSDKATVYIPYQMGYKEEGSGSTIKGYSTLIFEIYIDEVIHPYKNQ